MSYTTVAVVARVPEGCPHDFVVLDSTQIYSATSQNLSMMSFMGPSGTTGTTGAQGASGATGAQGVSGDTGPQGIQGNPGAPGATGADGAQGISGLTGATGIQGLRGAAGKDGTIWRVGSRTPAASLGTNGDFYLNAKTGYVYRKACGTYAVALLAQTPPRPQSVDIRGTLLHRMV